MAPLVTRNEFEIVSAMISRHHLLVYRLAYRILRNRADAEDVTQSVFLQLLRSADSLPAVNSQRAWIARVALHKALSFVRSEERRRRREQTWASKQQQERKGDSMAADDNSEIAAEALDAISRLPAELRLPVILRYQEGFKYREIAETCGCPEGTVAKRLSVARARLRRQLKHRAGIGSLPLLEETLSASPPIPSPEGLEESLRNSLAEEFRALGGGQAGASGIPGDVAAPGISAASGVGIALLCSTLLAGLGGWGIHESLALRSGGGEETAAATGKEPRGVRPAAGNRSTRAHRRASRRSRLVRGDTAATGEDGEEELAGTAGSDGASAAITGRVRDDGGRGVAGVEVVLLGVDSSAAIQTAVTDEEGYYEFREIAANGTWDLKRHAVQWLHSLEAFQEITALEENLSAELMDRNAISLVVSDTVASSAASGEEAMEAMVAAEAVYLDRVRLTADAMSFTGGEFVDVSHALVETSNSYDLSMTEVEADAEAYWTEISRAPRGLRVAVHPESYRPESSEPFELGEGETLQIDFDLHEILPLTGRVYSTAGRPVADAVVTILGHTGDRVLPEKRSRVVTGPDGEFSFPSLWPGAHVLRAAAEGFVPVERVVRTGGPPAILQLPRAGSLDVIVTAGGTGEVLQGLVVALRDEQYIVANSVTDEAGQASLENLAPGSYVLETYPETSGSRLSRATAEVWVEAGGVAVVRLDVDDQVSPGVEPIGAAEEPRSLMTLAAETGPEVDLAPLFPENRVVVIQEEMRLTSLLGLVAELCEAHLVVAADLEASGWLRHSRAGSQVSSPVRLLEEEFAKRGIRWRLEHGRLLLSGSPPSTVPKLEPH